MNRLRVVLVSALVLILALPMLGSAAVFRPRAINRYSSTAVTPPVSAQKYFNSVGGMAPTSDGQYLWVSDRYLDRIVKVRISDGAIVQTVGSRGSGNGQFREPTGIAIQANGNVLVCDFLNDRVQVFLPEGSYLRSFGWNGTGAGQLRGPEDICVDTNGDILVMEEIGKRVQRFDGTTYLVEAGSYPSASKLMGIMAEPGGGFAVLEYQSTLLAQITIVTQAFLPQGNQGSYGAGPTQLTYPVDLARDASGNRLVVDSWLHVVKRYSETDWLNSFGGPASNYGYWEMDYLQEPVQIAVVGSDLILVADTTGIKKFHMDGSAYDGAGWTGGQRTTGWFYQPTAIACWTAGDAAAERAVWVLDRSLDRLQKFKAETNGALTYVKTVPDASNGTDMDVDQYGNLYVSERSENKITKLDKDGNYVKDWYALTPTGIDVTNEYVYACDSTNNVVRVYNHDGTQPTTDTIGVTGTPALYGIAAINDVAVTNSRVYVLDGALYCVRSYKLPGATSGDIDSDFLGTFGTYLGFESYADGIASDYLGNIYLTDIETERIAKFNGYGTFLGDVASPGNAAGEVSLPWSVAVSPDLDVFAVEYGNRRVQAFRPYRATKAVIKSTNVPAYNTAASFSFDVLDADGIRTSFAHPMKLSRAYSPTGPWVAVTPDPWGAGTSYTTPYNLTRRMYFKVAAPAYGGYLASPAAVISVAPRVILGTPNAPSIMYTPTTYTIKGSLKPRHTAGTYPVRIYKYRWTGTAWKSYGYVKAVASNYSTYSLYAGKVRLPYTGKWMLKAYAPADSLHAATWSAADYVTVK